MKEPRNIPPYQRLSRVYDLDWGEWALQCVELTETLIQWLGLKKARILDLGCGTGTLAFALAEKGHSVKGVDLSKEMIHRAESKKQDDDNPEFEIDDMTKYVPGEKYEIVCCTFDAFNYLLEKEQILSMFRNVEKALKKGGVFLFDFNTEKLYRSRTISFFPRALGEKRFYQKLFYDPVENLASTIFEFPDGGVEIHYQRPWELEQVRSLLCKAGFKILKLFSDYSQTPFYPETERIITIAARFEDYPNT